MNLLRQLWNEDSGFVLSSEIVLVGSVLVVGVIAGLTSLRDSTVQELGDVAQAIGSLNQSYSIGGTWGHCAFTSGSRFFDTVDVCQTGVAVCADAPIATAATQVGYVGHHGPAYVRDFPQPAPVVAAPVPCPPQPVPAPCCPSCGHVEVQVLINGVPAACCQTPGCPNCGAGVPDGYHRGPLVHVQPVPHPAPHRDSHHARQETIEMRFSHVSDDDLKDIRDADRVKVLHIHASQVTDEGLKHLSGLKNLEELHIGGAKITDAGLRHLDDLERLRRLTIHGTAVTPEGLQKLRRELPNLQID